MLYDVPINAATAATALLGGAIAASYLDAKYAITKDLKLLYQMDKGRKSWAKAGSYHHFYYFLVLVPFLISCLTADLKIDPVKNKRASTFFLFQEAAQRYGDHEALWSRCGIYSWRQTYERTCQYGNWLASMGVKPGEFVAVYLLNSPVFVFIWMGLLSIGAAPALINYNLAGDALLHCVKISGAKFLLCDDDRGCQNRVEGVHQRLTAEVGAEVIVLSEELKRHLARSDATPPSQEFHNDHSNLGRLPLALVYTSGTTGMPKACRIGMDRHYPFGSLRIQILGQRLGPGGDRSYNCMPFYHGTGGLTLMNDLFSGLSVAIGRKFSISNFWQDCIDSNSTTIIYVGEVARYLLSAPPSPNDRKHKIRVMFGNGLRPDVWVRFQERFGIKEIAEFFASAEAMVFLINHCRNEFTVGAVGHHGLIQSTTHHNILVPAKVDVETGAIWRDPKTGFAKRMPYHEGGEILVRMANKNSWAGYYREEEATESKLLRDVFTKGDLFYRTGDALRRDKNGLWFFIDRLGDSYRWKGENVSATEVSQVIGRFPGILEANVYGVSLPNHDGRAGCAAIIRDPSLRHKFDWWSLAKYLQENLPRYAVPIFVRIIDRPLGSMCTGNNKQCKVPLREEGVDPDLRGKEFKGGSQDEVYWLAPKSEKYVPFRMEDWKALREERARL